MKDNEQKLKRLKDYFQKWLEELNTTELKDNEYLQQTTKFAAISEAFDNLQSNVEQLQERVTELEERDNFRTMNGI